MVRVIHDRGRALPILPRNVPPRLPWRKKDSLCTNIELKVSLRMRPERHACEMHAQLTGKSIASSAPSALLAGRA